MKTTAALALAFAIASFGSASASQTPSAISAANNQFLPPTIVVQAGSAVQFVNADVHQHSVTAIGTAPDSVAPLFDSGTIAPAETALVTGTETLKPSLDGYAFRCRIHPDMTGRIIVLG